MYTFKRQCQEDSSIFLGDDVTSIVLNTKGTVGDINEELKQVLRYMDVQLPTGEFANRLNKFVKYVKINEKWRVDYMTMAMKYKRKKKLLFLQTTSSL